MKPFVSNNIQFELHRGIDSVNMLSSVLLLLLISGSQADYYGFVYSSSTKDLQAGGFPTVARYLYSFSTCAEVDAQVCGNSCSFSEIILNKIQEISGEWCQKERLVSSVNNGSQLSQSGFSGGNWTDNRNGVVSFRVQMQDEKGIRSDTGRPNTSPLTTVLPVLRVPSNCQRNFSLLAFDPDGDEIRCRDAQNTSECDVCTPAPVLHLSPSCALTFSPTSSSNEGSYAVQLMMEDVAVQTITLTQANGGTSQRNAGDVLNKIPVQFVFKVDPVAPSCTGGVYLPRFLPPTPDNGAKLSTSVNQTLEISVRAEATQSEITELLFSGPHSVIRSESGPGAFTLRWTPSDFEGGLSHPICFVVRANFSSSVFTSDLRCVVVTVGNDSAAAAAPTGPPSSTPTPSVSIATARPPTTSTTSISTSANQTTPDPGPYYVIALNAKISAAASLINDKETLAQLIKEELISYGLPPTISVRILSSGSLEVTAAR
ncbi:uncharacterized protein LOC103149147 [Poecilia formosa]|uniref:uncharacterized protein LOC103149147 n=1 Tax=Poecilia formosa TaxID=48698 RepID=UPI0007B8F245|nr:PREDICTED: uncharacterized protein LOC103149147 [Poecilia formosa]